MLKILSVFSICVGAAWTFDHVEFQKKYCYKDTAVRTTAYYIPYRNGNLKTAYGYVCENFVLRKDDLDYMATNKFVLSNENFIFFKNCEVEYFNEYLVSKFPNVTGLYFDECKLSLKNPSTNVTTPIAPDFRYIGFHSCNIFDNLNTLALQKFNKLWSILVQNSTFQYPEIDEHFLPKVHNMYYFLMDNVNIRTMHKGLFSNSTHYLFRVSCTSCELNEIHSMLYGIKYGVYYSLNFNNNSITKLPTSLDLLASYNKLSELHLSGNRISEPLLKRIQFKSMTNLQVLDLSRNSNITGISYLTFKDIMLQKLNMSRVGLVELKKLGNSNLNTIDFSHNQITSFPVDVFEDLTQATFLDLSHNQIERLQDTVFQSLKSLEELRLNMNQISQLPSSFFVGLDSLRILDLSGNFLDCIIGLEALSQLQELRIHSNFLKMVPSGEALPNSLRLLDFSKNPVEFIGRNSFSNLNKLELLDISSINNTYLDFDRESFKPLLSLRTLILTENHIAAIEDFFLPSSLEDLDLSNNNISTVSEKSLAPLKNLEYLNLAYNHIDVIEKDAIAQLPKIKFVNISGNYL